MNPLPIRFDRIRTIVLQRIPTNCTYTRATLTDAGDYHMTRQKKDRYPLIFLAVFVPLCLCDVSKKQAKERALDIKAAAEKMIFFEEATGV